MDYAPPSAHFLSLFGFSLAVEFIFAIVGFCAGACKGRRNSNLGELRVEVGRDPEVSFKAIFNPLSESFVRMGTIPEASFEAFYSGIQVIEEDGIKASGFRACGVDPCKAWAHSTAYDDG